MSGKRVLFFGVTGVDKVAAMRRLAEWARDHRTRPGIDVVDFEDQYLFNPGRGGNDWYSFLDDRQQIQRETWRRSWERFLQDIHPAEGEDLFVGIHGCIVRGHYGVRSVIDPCAVVRDLRPDLIVTLLDDVYDMWWRTEQRAGGEAWKGVPSIEQLLFARRSELIVADQVAHSVDPPIPHFVISVAHPCETLANRIYSSRPVVVYLCFPISAPRDLIGDESGGSGPAEIMEFLRLGFERQRGNPNLVLVCPLGIDELPLVKAMEDPSTHEQSHEQGEDVVRIRFDRDALRWNMDGLWPRRNCLSIGPPPPEHRKPIPLLQLKAAAGMIHSDVGWRDYRLVEQARGGCLAAFNPKFKNRQQLSRSVREEIRFAAGICPVYVYQDSEHDPDGIFEAEYPRGGTMLPGPESQMVVRKETEEEVFDAVEALAGSGSR